MKKIINAFLIGIGYGMLVYLSILFWNGVETQTLFNIATVSFLSGLIGVVSLIFEVDRIAFVWQLILHYILVLSIVITLNIVNGFPIRLEHSFFWLEFNGVYLCIWMSVYLLVYRKVNRINQKLQDRRRQKESN